MKILYGITRSNWGGAQAHLYELIKDQVNRGNEVILFVGEAGELTKRVSCVENVKIIVLNSVSRNLNPIKDLIAIKEIKSIINKETPDIVHVHSSKAGALGRIAARKSKAKVIFTAHGWAFTDGVGKKKALLYKKIEKYLTKFSDKIICVSKFDLKIAKDAQFFKGNTKGVCIYNGVVEPSDIKFIRDFGIPKMVMVARFDNQKNQELLINSLVKFKEYDFNMTFIGDGPNLVKCKSIVEKENLTSKIFFEGFKSNVDDFLKESNCFVLSTNYEGLPISIIEAMSYRLPIISSNVGGVSEQIENNSSGILVNNENEWENVLKKIFEGNYDLNKMGRKSYSIFTEKFLLNDMLEQNNTTYELVRDNK